MLDTYTAIETWNEDDLADLPQQETDEYEYKSSRIRENLEKYRSELQSKVCKAASAFWNTGGGVLVVGVDDEGNIDGGIPVMMGRQRLRDWVDQVLNTVVPIGTYAVKCITPEKPDSKIEPQHVVLVIGFGESFDLPHMAPDHRYYVRAGAHSNPANHYLVEAIRARRGLRRPMLRGLLREHPRKLGVVELVILAVNDMPALNVQIRFEPLPALYRNHSNSVDVFPLVIPVIDRETPFTMDIGHFLDGNALETFTVYLRYQGMMGKPIEEHQLLDPRHNIAPLQWSGIDDKTQKSLKRIADELESLTKLLKDKKN
jgi:hypothetical protein